MKKIMFSDRYGLTQAVLEGKKTMTRRIINLCDKDLNFLKVKDNGEWLFSSRTCLDGAFPAFQIGEKVAIAQRYRDLLSNDRFLKNLQKEDPSFTLEYIRGKKGYHNKMFVRADWMPSRISISNFKAEKLQDISEKDAMREGVEKWIDCYIVPGIMENHGKNNVCFETPREAFATLIDRISGGGTWKRNPWVFAYEFELMMEISINDS